MAGQYSFASVPAKPLINSMKAAQGVNSFGFASRVGGVAFGAVASPSDGSRITAIHYSPIAPDGRRLEVTIQKADKSYEVTIPAYDWLLVPVAKFADGDQDALFTFFGGLQDELNEKARRDAGQKILNYHEAIQDTFLGLRLMQADLLAFHPLGPENLAEDGEVLKAPGERPRTVERNKLDFVVLNEIYKSGKARSYVISDVKGGVRFKLETSDETPTIKFTGIPYWSCWRLRIDPETFIPKFFEQPEIKNRIAKRVLDRMTRSGIGLDTSSSPSPKDLKRIQQFHNEESEFVLRQEIDAKYFEVLPDLSRRLSAKMAELEGGNPPVYSALRQTMHLAAFYRHVKKIQPTVYSAFLRQVLLVTPQPTVQTPTVLIPPSK